MTKSVMHQGPESFPLHNEINCQINQTSTKSLTSTKSSVDDFVNVTQNSEWFPGRKYKVTGSRLPSLGLSRKSKFD